VDATARLIGAESLPARQQFLLLTARMFEDGFLRQNAFDAADATCSPHRQFRLLRLLLRFHERGLEALERGVSVQDVAKLQVLARIARAKSDIGDDALAGFDELEAAIGRECAALETGVSAS